MRFLRYFVLLGAMVVPAAFLATPANAQVGVGIGVGVGDGGYGYGDYGYPAPVCSWGYYNYYPYACAPYGYYGPSWFVGGIFIGAGPWYHGYWGRGGYGWGHGYGYGRGVGYRGGYGGGYRGGVGYARGGNSFRGGSAYGGGARGFAGGGGVHTMTTGGGGFRFLHQGFGGDLPFLGGAGHQGAPAGEVEGVPRHGQAVRPWLMPR